MEIKFRGMHTKMKQFVTGLPAYDMGGQITMLQDFLEGTCDCYFEIIPETLGQFTGLKDRNGKEVYEGDIIRCTKGCPHAVEWVKEYAGTFGGGMPAFYLSGLREGYAWTGEEEVIGNIYDKTELLTKGD